MVEMPYRQIGRVHHTDEIDVKQLGIGPFRFIAFQTCTM